MHVSLSGLCGINLAPSSSAGLKQLIRCVNILMEGWLLVSCSCSSSSVKEVMKELSAEEDTVLLQEEEQGEA